MSMDRQACLFVLLAALGGCTRSICTTGSSWFRGSDDPWDPISSVWQAHKAWIPPSATVCGHTKNVQTQGFDSSKSLNVDFEKDDNPMVGVIGHLESQGLKRTSQDIGNPEFQSATFQGPNESLEVTAIRERGRTRAVLSLREKM